jgi:hypothetical protein
MTIKHPTYQQIAARAYQLYLERGRQDGHEVDDWLQAEYELMQLPVQKLAEIEPSQIPAPKAKGRKGSIVEVVRAAMML